MKKTLIFDLDGTLYNLNDVIEMSYQMQLSFASKKMRLSLEETEKMFRENNIYSQKNMNSQSATELFEKWGFDIKEWSQYRSTRFDVSKINIDNLNTSKILADLSRKYELILCSSNVIDIVLNILRRLDISDSLFSDIYCSNNNINTGFSKFEVFRHLALKYNSGELLSIGDRYKTDIEPALKNKIDGFLVNSPRDLELIDGVINNSITTNGYFTAII